MTFYTSCAFILHEMCRRKLIVEVQLFVSEQVCKLQKLYDLSSEENELFLIKERAAEAKEALELEALASEMEG